MNAKKCIFSALCGGRVDRIPAWLPVVPVTVSMMEISKAPWPESHSNAEQMARLAAMPWELTGLLPFPGSGSAWLSVGLGNRQPHAFGEEASGLKTR